MPKDLHINFPGPKALKLVLLWSQVLESTKCQQSTCQSLSSLWWFFIPLWEEGILTLRESSIVNIWQYAFPAPKSPKIYWRQGSPLSSKQRQVKYFLSQQPGHWHVELAWNRKWVVQRNMGYLKISSGNTSNIRLWWYPGPSVPWPQLCIQRLASLGTCISPKPISLAALSSILQVTQSPSNKFLSCLS